MVEHLLTTDVRTKTLCGRGEVSNDGTAKVTQQELLKLRHTLWMHMDEINNKLMELKRKGEITISKTQRRRELPNRNHWKSLARKGVGDVRCLQWRIKGDLRNSCLPHPWLINTWKWLGCLTHQLIGLWTTLTMEFFWIWGGRLLKNTQRWHKRTSRWSWTPNN